MNKTTDENRENLYDYADDSQFFGKSNVEIFNEIYEKNIWTDPESVSGIGSSLIQTQEIIYQLPILLKKFQIQTMLDIPCGDFNWMSKINFGEMKYVGADLVEKVVCNNQQNFADLDFILLDLINDKIGKYDLIFCRDCFVHFSFEDIFSSLENIKNSGSTYLLTTTFPKQEINKPIKTGGWRPLNFNLSPFNFPEPIYLINEKCTEMNGEFADKSLGLWEISKL